MLAEAATRKLLLVLALGTLAELAFPVWIKVPRSGTATRRLMTDDGRSLASRFENKSVANYYVSASGNDRSGDGSRPRPWATINYANSKLGSSGHTLGMGGTVIHVADGTYSVACSGKCTVGYGGEAIKTTVSGTASARVRWVSDHRWGAHIVSSGYAWKRGVGVGAANGANITWYNTGDYVDIVGFDISGDGHIGIANDGSYVQTLSNHIHNITAPGACSGFAGGAAGVDNTNNSVGQSSDAIGNWIHDVGDLNHRCASGGHGIYQAAHQGKLQNNLIYRVQGYGVHLWHHATNISVTFNTVFQAYGGVVVGGSDGSTNENTVVANNILVNNQAYGLVELGSVGSHNAYASNVISGNHIDLSLLSGHAATGTINVTAGTLFVNWQQDGSGDYHLRAGSAAIDAAAPAYTASSDFAGGARPVNGLYDIGCYEYNAPPQVWPWW